MTHSNEPSYYEISLTNRQVLTVFVVLLVCIVVAFFSGVWVGRREAPVEQIEVADQNMAENPEATGDGTAVGELHFFSEGAGQSGQPPDLADEPKPGSTLLEDLEQADSSDESRPDSAPDTASPAMPQQVPPAAAAAKVTERTGEHVIQVFSSSDEKQATGLLRQLERGGYPAFLSPVEVGGKTMYRVRIGPYTKEAEAEAVADRVRKAYKLDTWVTR